MTKPKTAKTKKPASKKSPSNNPVPMDEKVEAPWSDAEELNTLAMVVPLGSSTIDNEKIQLFQDSFLVESNNVFPQHLITEIILPKVIAGPNDDFVSVSYQHLVMQILNMKPVSGNVLQALKTGLPIFEIKIFEDTEDVEIDVEDKSQFTLWRFLNPKIVAVDFGNIVSQSRPGYRTIQCEIDFSGLEIDGVSIKTK